MKTQKATMVSQPRTKNTNESYAASAKGALKRIRTPHPHDVLSGRGGGINSHVGNKTFREWVRVRKEDYNLAGSKAEKARVANEVMELVRNQNPPGRFLQRESNSAAGPCWWVEVDEARALAKTSQALREGAPQIRAAHKDELHERVERARKSKRRKTSANSRALAPVIRQNPPGNPQQQAPFSLPAFGGPLPTATAPFQTPGPVAPQQTRSTVPHTRSVSTDKALESLQRNVEAAKLQAEHQPNPLAAPSKSNKIVDDNHRRANDPLVDPSAETPPLAPVPHQPIPPIPPLTPFGRSKSNAGRNNGLPRMHSLALSDVSTGDFANGNEEFVNPFADESDIYSKVDATPPARQTRLLRNISSDEGQDKPENSRSNNSNNDHSPNGRKRTSLGSMSTRSLAELSDIIDNTYQADDTDFGEGMKSILDAVHPDLTSPDMDESIPTLLMPWRGGGLKRGPSSLSSRAPARQLSGRQ